MIDSFAEKVSNSRSPLSSIAGALEKTVTRLNGRLSQEYDITASQNTHSFIERTANKRGFERR